MHGGALWGRRRPQPPTRRRRCNDDGDAAENGRRPARTVVPSPSNMLPSFLARRRRQGASLLLASALGRRHWPASSGAGIGALSTTTTTTTTTTAAAAAATAAPNGGSAAGPRPPPAPPAAVDLPATVSRIVRSLEHERGLGFGDARGARASFSEFMAGPAGLARLATPWLPPGERAALARLRDAFAGYGGLPLPAREALLEDAARLTDRHAHFLREGAWPAAAAGGAAQVAGRERSPSPPPMRHQQPPQQQQQPRPGSVLRRRAGLPNVSSPRARPASASVSPQQRPATASASPPPPPLPEAAAMLDACWTPLAPSPPPAASIFPPEEERASFAAALDQLLPLGEEEEEDAELIDEAVLGDEGGEEEEEAEEEAAASAAAPAPVLPPLPFRAPPSHPALRRLQRRTSSVGAAPQEQQPRQQQQAAFAFEPLLHGQAPHQASSSSPSSPLPSADLQQQQQQQRPQPSPPLPTATAPPTSSSSLRSRSPSPSPTAAIDLDAAWRLYWPVPPLEHWRELDARARGAAEAAAAGGRTVGGGIDGEEDEEGGGDGAAVRARPMMPTESLGPRDEPAAGAAAAAAVGDSPPPHSEEAAGASPPLPLPPPSPSSSLAALFEEMCAPGGAPAGLGAFVEEPPLLPLAFVPDDLWGPGLGQEEEDAEASGSLSDDAAAADDALLPSAAASAAASSSPPGRHLVWRPAPEAGGGLLLPSSYGSSGGVGDPASLLGRDPYGDGGADGDDDHAAWRAFVESAVAWRRRDDADARALRALSRAPDEDQQRTPDWHAARGSRLTASAFCNAVGWFGRYPAARLLDAQRLWREKVGLEPPPPPNAAMRRGTALEPLAQRAYARLVAEARGGRVEPCSFKTWSEGPAHDWLSASPDGLVQVPPMVGMGGGDGAAVAAAAAAAAHGANGASAANALLLPPALALARGPGVLEIKCPNKELADPAQHVRRLDYYAMQVQGQLEFSGREWAHLYLWTPASGSALALVRRDRRYWRLLWQVLADFWWGHVAPARALRREGAADADVMAYLPRREHPWAAELRAASRRMLRDAPVLGFAPGGGGGGGGGGGDAAAAVADAAAAVAAAEAAGAE